jgi:hypothetical protein
MKNLLFFLLLFVSVASFGQIKIEPVSIGWPAKQATDLMVRVMPFQTDAKTCDLYYEIRRCENQLQITATCEVLASGNLSLSESQFAAWSSDNGFIEQIALSKLLLTRKND